MKIKLYVGKLVKPQLWRKFETKLFGLAWLGRKLVPCPGADEEQVLYAKPKATCAPLFADWKIGVNMSIWLKYLHVCNYTSIENKPQKRRLTEVTTKQQRKYFTSNTHLPGLCHVLHVFLSAWYANSSCLPASVLTELPYAQIADTFSCQLLISE